MVLKLNGDKFLHPNIIISTKASLDLGIIDNSFGIGVGILLLVCDRKGQEMPAKPANFDCF